MYVVKSHTLSPNVEYFYGITIPTAIMFPRLCKGITSGIGHIFGHMET